MWVWVWVWVWLWLWVWVWVIVFDRVIVCACVSSFMSARLYKSFASDVMLHGLIGEPCKVVCFQPYALRLNPDV